MRMRPFRSLRRTGTCGVNAHTIYVAATDVAACSSGFRFSGIDLDPAAHCVAVERLGLYLEGETV